MAEIRAIIYLGRLQTMPENLAAAGRSAGKTLPDFREDMAFRSPHAFPKAEPILVPESHCGRLKLFGLPYTLTLGGFPQ